MDNDIRIKCESAYIDLSAKNIDGHDYSECTFLDVRSFNPKSRSLSELPHAPKLQKLNIVLTNITDFKGIEKFLDIREIDISYCRSLCSFAGLEAVSENITSISVENAGKLCGYEELAKFPRLEKICFANCGKIDSIDFILKMHSLKHFVFMKTDVCDSDLSPLVNHEPKLEYAAFSDKKHFSHKLTDIWEYLELYDMLNHSLTLKEEQRTAKRIEKHLSDEGKHISGYNSECLSDGSIKITITDNKGNVIIETVPAVKKYPRK